MTPTLPSTYIILHGWDLGEGYVDYLLI